MLYGGAPARISIFFPRQIDYPYLFLRPHSAQSANSEIFRTPQSHEQEFNPRQRIYKARARSRKIKHPRKCTALLCRPPSPYPRWATQWATQSCTHSKHPLTRSPRRNPPSAALQAAALPLFCAFLSSLAVALIWRLTRAENARRRLLALSPLDPLRPLLRCLTRGAIGRALRLGGGAAADQNAGGAPKQVVYAADRKAARAAAAASGPAPLDLPTFSEIRPAPSSAPSEHSSGSISNTFCGYEQQTAKGFVWMVRGGRDTTANIIFPSGCSRVRFQTHCIPMRAVSVESKLCGTYL